MRYVEGEIRLRALPSLRATALDEVAGCLAKPGRKRVSDTKAQANVKMRLKARHAP